MPKSRTPRSFSWRIRTLILDQALRAAIHDGHRNALYPAATFEDGLAHIAYSMPRVNSRLTVDAG